MRFAESFPDEGIVSTLSRQLGWSHFLEIVHLDDPLRRDFYAEMCKSSDHVKLLQLEQSGIRVAEDLTELPPREVLERKLHDAVKAARERMALIESNRSHDG